MDIPKKLQELHELLIKNFSDDDIWENGGCLSLAFSISRYMIENNLDWRLGAFIEDDGRLLHFFIEYDTNLVIDMHGVQNYNDMSTLYYEEFGEDWEYVNLNKPPTSMIEWKNLGKKYNVHWYGTPDLETGLF